jgi:phosphotransferase system IIB component
MLKRLRQQLQKDKEGIIKRNKEEIKSIPKLVKRLRSTYVQKSKLSKDSFARQGVRDCVNS